MLEKFALPDFLMMGVFFGLFLGLHFFAKKRNSVAKQETKLALPFFTISLVSTWCAGILGAGEFIYTDGIVAWVVSGIPYCIFAFLFVFLISDKTQKDKLSISQRIGKNYGIFAQRIAAILIFLSSSPAPYILMMAALLKIFLPASVMHLSFCVIAFVFTMVLARRFGQLSINNTMEFVWMYLGFFILLVCCLLHFGPPTEILTALPTQHLKWHGNLSWDRLFGWFSVGIWSFVDPCLQQRTRSAQSPQTARKGVLIAIVLWIIFDFLSLLCGLYAKAFVGNLSVPTQSFIVLALNVLPSGILGIFIAGLTIIMGSSLLNYSISAVENLQIDWKACSFQTNKGEVELKKNGQPLNPALAQLSLAVSHDKLGQKTALLLFSLVFSCFLIYKIPRVADLWYMLGTFFIPALLLPTLGCHYAVLRISKFSCVIHLLICPLIALALSTIAKLGFDPMYAGLMCSFVLYVLDLMIKTAHHTLHKESAYVLEQKQVVGLATIESHR